MRVVMTVAVQAVLMRGGITILMTLMLFLIVFDVNRLFQ